MRKGERIRLRFVFGALGCVPVFLAGWLAWLQVGQRGQILRDGKAPLRLVAATADRQAEAVEVMPQPRGSIVDRNGSVLAVDCEVYDVRARIAVPSKEGKTCATLRAWLEEVADDFARAMVADTSLSDRRESQRLYREQFRASLEKAFRTRLLPADGPVPADQPRVADVRIAGAVDVLAVVDALREVGERRGSVSMHFLRSWQRSYPERESTYGIVGHVDSRWTVDEGTAAPKLTTFGVCGLEALAALLPDEAVTRTSLRDGKGLTYFRAPVEPVARPNVLHSTLDVDLQRIAVRELSAQAEAGAREGKVTIPQWGALVLVEMATGDVLAAASWHRDGKHPEAEAFTPYQMLYEPGSIVKPLVFAYALEAGVLDWSHAFDCAPGSSDYRERIGSVGNRVVRDDHACGVLTPHGILVNSSNIGASYVGLQLEREQWHDYMRFFGFGAPLNLHVPFESRGGAEKSFDPSITLRSFRRNSAISFSFGYEMQVTAMHIARAYLRLFRGASADLRLCRGVDVDGTWLPVPTYPVVGPRFRPDVVDAVRAAMVDVVSDDPHATGAVMHGRMLKELGVDLHGVIAGKTGTAASRIGRRDGSKIEVRNASFVGFLPAHDPRWLAVCVLQKDDSARFYGGSYAAPPAVRLLLQAQSLEQRRMVQREPQVGAGGQTRTASGSPGDSGWSR